MRRRYAMALGAVGVLEYPPDRPTWRPLVAATLVFETHSITIDNERGVATGWQPGELSDAGRVLAVELGARRRDDGIAVTLTSDLARAVDTARIAFAASSMPILHDWRLRECNYGRRTGMPVEELAATRSSHRDALPRGRELARRNRSGRPIPRRRLLAVAGRARAVIGHTATRWGLDHHLHGLDLNELLDAEFQWQPGWEYAL